MAAATVEIIKNWLIPLPRDIKIIGLYDFSPEKSVLVVNSSLSPSEEGAVKELEAYWQTTYGKPLKVRTDDEGGTNEVSLKIIFGQEGKNSLIDKAVKSGEIRIEELRKCPNREQAYLIQSVTPAKKDDAQKIYLVGGGNGGCYYAANTLQQLLQSQAGAGKIPLVAILDWPDLAKRGLWGCGLHTTGIEPLAKVKMNLAYMPAVGLNVSDSKQISACMNPRFVETVQIGKRLNIEVVPMLFHTDIIFRAFQKHFPEILAAGEWIKPGQNGGFWPMCFANPKTQQVMDEILISITQLPSDTIQVAMAEEAVCKCEKCRVTPYIGEIDCIIKAFEKAKKIKPSLNLSLCFSQGTYPYNSKIAERIPKDVQIEFYNSGLTYSTKRSPMIPPEISALVEEGRPVIAVPLFGGSWSDNTQYPFTTAGFVKERMNELVTKKLKGFTGWMPPHISILEFNMEAMGEYGWNAAGRTPREFAVAWATRKGYSPADAENIALVCTLLEEPERSFSICEDNWSLRNMFKGVMKAFHGEYGMGNALKGFSNEVDYSNQLNLCSQAGEIAWKIQNPRFLCEANFVYRWISLLNHCYLLCGANPRQKSNSEKAAVLFAAIERDTRDILVAYEQWIKTWAPDPSFCFVPGGTPAEWRDGLKKTLSDFEEQMSLFKKSCLNK